MNTPENAVHWRTPIARAIATCTLFRDVLIVPETDSTQDHAVRLELQPGSVIVADRQTSGRGRLGRAWHDPDGHGVAMTLVLADQSVARLAIASAIGVAHAIEQLCERRAGVKWPNDVMIDGKKIAGILVEASGAIARVGIGLNVLQTTWADPHLAARAVSLAQAGYRGDRACAIAAVLPCIDRAFGMSERELTSEFKSRDWLRGNRARLVHDQRVFEGVVVEVEPFHSLIVECADGRHCLPAATTTIESLLGR